MNSANETAEAIWILIKRIVKWISIILIVIVACFFAMLKVTEYYEWLTHGMYEEKIVIDLYVAKINDCDKDYPYLYIIRNNSDKIIEETSFYVEIKKIGYSNKINSTTSITDSKILKPNESTFGCFRAGKKEGMGDVIESDVDFSVSLKNVKFQK